MRLRAAVLALLFAGCAPERERQPAPAEEAPDADAPTVADAGIERPAVADVAPAEPDAGEAADARVAQDSAAVRDTGAAADASFAVDAGAAWPAAGPGDGDFVVPPPYTLTADSRVQPGVPQGKLLPLDIPSKVYGKTYKVQLYVPQQYDGTTPAAVMVFQDANHYVRDARAPTVFDNLIHKKQIPVLLGIFINPIDRSVEYDSLGDKYARFVIEDVLPFVAKTHKISDDPRHRAIGGFSSGGICAFTVAWERPEAFARVLTHNGSFVNIRGGNRYPMIVRAAPRKPLKVSLLSGTKDLVNGYGSWPEGNRAMAAALKEKGYVYRFVFGQEGHGFGHSGPDFPDNLRWLWRD